MINLYLRKLRCHVETDEVGADEPYAFVTAVNLSSSPPVSKSSGTDHLEM